MRINTSLDLERERERERETYFTAAKDSKEMKNSRTMENHRKTTTLKS